MTPPSEGAAAAPAPKLRAAGPVRISLPAKVAYDPKAFKNSIASVVERLGCPRCFSGADCYFQMERAFAVNPQAKVNPEPQPWAVSGPNPEPALAHQVTVGLAKGVKYDLDKVFRAVDKVIDLIGPHPCISGFDTHFRDEMIIVNEQLQAEKF